VYRLKSYFLNDRNFPKMTEISEKGQKFWKNNEISFAFSHFGQFKKMTKKLFQSFRSFLTSTP